ncbi:leishmanolysin family protein, putative [Ichthyophthirius multifiliis]|uniref:Leishmanolysin family protein, putative n=1 Tax=Ichthyophthirius multifiliis TaxID=5932 RepID=G0R6J5_ICHMU|nr:leishmanolysin family protein, putative [Ichthyophthirius multifiliis]EGR26906.1 leishmanolysin family protein, putative [Ichthyophthirius multifiliis]|eukprot:XP_004023790.1 leishmanolysin family protein, putative [Ichthyophthirius multifiliis]
MKKKYKYESIPPDLESLDIRHLQNKTPRNMLISYDIDHFKTLEKNAQNKMLTAVCEKTIQLAIDFFSRLIKIIPKSEPNMRYKQSHKCGEVTVPQKDIIQGKRSDLHIYVQYKIEPEEEYQAYAGWCQFLDVLGPTHGQVVFNLGQLKSQNISNPIEFEDLMEIVIHEIIHILGFMGTDIPKWVNKQKIHHRDPTIQKQIRGINTLLIKTPNVLEHARKYFGCPTLIGMPLEYSDDKQSTNSHWRNSDIQNEYMNTFVSPTQAYFSAFTTNLLRDTGFYFEINASMEEQTFFGQGAGCDHVLGKCDKPTNEYCNPQTDNDLCDYYHHGQSACYQESGCNVLVNYSNGNCWDTNSNQNTIEVQQNKGAKFGFNSRCFNGNLLVKSSKPNKQNQKIEGNCYEYECDSKRQQLTIWVGKIKKVCKNNLDKLEFEGYQGYIQCPKNISEFCSFKKLCPGFCSGNGYCLKNTCNCADEYAGNDCSIEKNR